MLRAVVIAFSLLISPALLHAQDVGAEPLTVRISPQYPKPYQTVVVTPASTLIDLSASTVSVSANGTLVQKGTGAEKANVTLGAPGTATTISVSAVNNGKTYTKQVVVRPADAALIIEPSTTAHPFYKGGVAVAPEGGLRLIALPDLRNASGRIAPESLVYTWRLGDRVLEAQSGIGKTTLTATAPVRYRDTTVTLTVATQDSSIVAQTSAVVAPIDPLMRVYSNDPLLGPLFEKAFSGTVTLTGNEQTFRTVPYFFPSTPTLTWFVNSAVSGADRDITLRSTGSGGGTATLTASGKHPQNFQTASTRITVKFGNESGLGIFGL